MPTSYAYQSLNGVENSFAPDNTGNSRFWYDRLGRVVFSHNWEQFSPANGGVANRYSYTNYDAQGRIIEVGEKSGTTTLAATPFLTDTQVNTMNTTGTNTQITRTYYDEPYAAAGLTQDNLRKRVSAVTYQDAATGGPQQATYYSYDQIGNVKTLWQQIQDLGTKRVDYQYDLVSGKVNKVRYQQGAADRFFYNYEYDAENRLTKARTGINSTSGDAWEIENPKTDAAYRYYLHGPLARIELGNTALVQGLDYAYTLQGWLKGVNGNYLSAANDMGKDGVVGSTRVVVGRDAYAYTLDYFSGDYQPIGTGQTAITLNWGSQSGDVMGRNLYNGNISRSTLALSNINSGASVGYTYRYDQLNRLTAMRQHGLTVGDTTWNTTSIGFPFKEDVKYDGNGNILSYVRYGSGASGKTLPMDSMNYVYTKDALGYLKNNRLTQVLDRVSGDPYTNDISNQAANNYLYDNIGNLIKDVEGGVSNIQWTVYGKIKSITKADGSSLEYRYDAGGNRIYKAYTHGGVTDKSWYVRDAQGNTLAIYGNKDGGSTLYWKEQELYGSSRLGIWTPDVAVGTDVSSIWDNLGIKHYELSNHLGNVLATISDKPVLEGDHYKAELLSAQDYYPFGMLQPDRSYSLGSYRYGFNGKENDNEVKGEGNQQDYGMRVYDPRIGRFLSVDPLTQKYPELTPYQFASNTPIWAIDIDGAEGGIPISYGGGQSTNEIVSRTNIVKDFGKWLDAPAHKGMAYSYNLASNLPKGTVETNRDLLNAMFQTGAQYMMHRFGNSKIVARVNASNLAPQTPGVEVAIKTTQPAMKLSSEPINVGEEDGYAIVRDPANSKVVGKGWLTEGALSLYIKTKGTTLDGRGGDVLKGIFNYINTEFDEIRSIRGIWRAGDLSDNLDAFNKSLKKYGGDETAAQKAVMETFTGEMAKRLGYTGTPKVSLGTEKDEDGNYKSVDVIFTKPK
ncbi:hypothetical protein GO495_12075 [Chitinophaga oryziterrae]|uniref:RHS repeat-associated core domain-containing protein n=1 Tax=Chitinophaga oryziterrae TaxID=1031224 RepID=A0A6N8J8N7_9BACT|nr:RHS repeat-associated core domain-containing protein [Chitinophaga oryziterrae]MVT41324.1 hypothetical protein [Chitinophaga oryziterrae]